ncbi:enoyl-CoA hydratase/isomerase family protein [Streptomyces sp. NPDC050287]|uniref:enoyl-CoA hydratase/isomerase family protein n=1 Tax=Streptomyces sp. NPDC050287 TaxID=3365608 RepID=UPI0037959F64
MTNDAHSTLRVSSEHGVARIVLDNPPVNVLGATMMGELRTVLTTLADDSSVRVIVFSSADPEFFLAHVDMRIGEKMDALEELAASAPADVNVFQSLGELIRHQPQVTIVKLAGKARGVLRLDQPGPASRRARRVRRPCRSQYRRAARRRHRSSQALAARR